MDWSWVPKPFRVDSFVLPRYDLLQYDTSEFNEGRKHRVPPGRRDSGGQMLGARTRAHLVAWGGLVLFTSLMSSCSSSKPTPTPPGAPELWGTLKPVVSVKELMRDMLDPIADNIFDSVGFVTDKKGTVETAPRTEEDWEKIRIGAVTLAEGVYLLKVPRPFAPAGDLNNSTGPDAVELSPAQITAKVE